MNEKLKKIEELKITAIELSKLLDNNIQIQIDVNSYTHSTSVKLTEKF
jgi:hypothetical protein